MTTARCNLTVGTADGQRRRRRPASLFDREILRQALIGSFTQARPAGRRCGTP